MRTPSKAEYNRALTELGATCMEPIHRDRRGGIPSLFKEKHARLNDSEDKVCHALAVVNAYVKALEDRCEAAESQVSEMVTGEGEEDGEVISIETGKTATGGLDLSGYKAKSMPAPVIRVHGPGSHGEWKLYRIDGATKQPSGNYSIKMTLKKQSDRSLPFISQDLKLSDLPNGNYRIASFSRDDKNYVSRYVRIMKGVIVNVSESDEDVAIWLSADRHRESNYKENQSHVANDVMAPMGEGHSHDNPTGDAVCTGCAGKKHKCKACEK